jgi:hypothetical protein
MKLLTLVKGAAIALAALGTVMPTTQVQAASNTLKVVRTDATVLDIGMKQDGVFTGRVVDHTGAPARGAEVVVRQGDKVVTTVKTDDQGTFAVSGLRGGLYDVSSGKTSGQFRVWTESAAPSAAKETALIVLGENGTRGSIGGIGGGELLLLAGVLTAVIISAITLSQVNDIPKSN